MVYRWLSCKHWRGHKRKKRKNAALVMAARKFLAKQRELVITSKLAAIKKATLLLPIRKEESLVEGQG